MSNPWVLFAGLVFILCAMYWFGYWMKTNNDASALRKAKWVDQNIHFVSGDGIAFGPYQILTIDGGKSWYNYKMDDGKVVILGPADPKLVEHNEAFDALVNYAEKHGPIDPGNMTDEAAKILTGAGFTVEKSN